MTAQPENEGQEELITLEGDDGQSYACKLVDIIDFEDKEYVLLQHRDPQKEEEEGDIVIMRFLQRDDKSIFQTIESEEEFDRVVGHVQELIAQMGSEEGESES